MPNSDWLAKSDLFILVFTWNYIF